MNRKLFLSVLLVITFMTVKAQQTTIRISTNETDLILKTSAKGRLYQSYLGDKLLNEKDISALSNRTWEVYPGSGAEDYYESAFAIQHNDGNLTSVLKYVSHIQNNISKEITETIIQLKDDVYPTEVTVHYVAYSVENVIKTWTEIKHNEKKPLTISQYVSSMLYFEADKYFLTEFSGEWAREVRPSSQPLQFGKKVIDTKLGSRAAMHTYPFFQLGLGQEVQENQGDVVLGTIAWTGNFRFTFEVDDAANLRVISGINPYASNYELKPNEVFTTPEFIFTRSDSGTGKASRNLHNWARNYQLKDGRGNRLTLLNNWESTGFKFDEKILGDLMHEAKQLGVDMFLLDDGWFGNKYPRANDRAGLGDWDVTQSKLPNGIPGLVKLAKEAGVQFGIWIEPEMANPKSELLEKHPDWAIRLPNRETYYFRNQLVLDLSNPAVQDYVFGVLDNILKENPAIKYFKWDCNSPITNIYSPYLKKKQNQLYIDHVRGVTNVFKRVNDKYPDLQMMLCSGGGARCDYEALKYFTEFWCSDNTDPVERLYIQWNFSQFFPVKAMAAHVTSWNKKASIKFRTDVAMMCKLGFDISIKELNENEQTFCKEAVANYNRLKPIILEGNLYRLVSPFQSNHTAVMQVDDTQNKAVLFAYDIHPRYAEKLFKVKLQGLDPLKTYSLKEINLMPGTPSFSRPAQHFTGDYLMKVGIDAFMTREMNSRIFEIEAE